MRMTMRMTMPPCLLILLVLIHWTEGGKGLLAVGMIDDEDFGASGSGDDGLFVSEWDDNGIGSGAEAEILLIAPPVPPPSSGRDNPPEMSSVKPISKTRGISLDDNVTATEVGSPETGTSGAETCEESATPSEAVALGQQYLDRLDSVTRNFQNELTYNKYVVSTLIFGKARELVVVISAQLGQVLGAECLPFLFPHLELTINSTSTTSGRLIETRCNAARESLDGQLSEFENLISVNQKFRENTEILLKDMDLQMGNLRLEFKNAFDITLGNCRHSAEPSTPIEVPEFLRRPPLEDVPLEAAESSVIHSLTRPEQSELIPTSNQLTNLEFLGTSDDQALDLKVHMLEQLPEPYRTDAFIQLINETPMEDDPTIFKLANLVKRSVDHLLLNSKIKYLFPKQVQNVVWLPELKILAHVKEQSRSFKLYLDERGDMKTIQVPLVASPESRISSDDDVWQFIPTLHGDAFVLLNIRTMSVLKAEVSMGSGGLLSRIIVEKIEEEPNNFEELVRSPSYQWELKLSCRLREQDGCFVSIETRGEEDLALGLNRYYDEVKLVSGAHPGLFEFKEH